MVSCPLELIFEATTFVQVIYMTTNDGRIYGRVSELTMKFQELPHGWRRSSPEGRASHG